MKKCSCKKECECLVIGEEVRKDLIASAHSIRVLAPYLSRKLIDVLK